MRRHSLKSGLKNIISKRELLFSLVRREINQKYKGTSFGIIWSVIYPLLMLSVYGVVFGGIFNSRWSPKGEIKEFLLMVFCGLIIHGLFSETLTQAPSAIFNNPNYVKKVVFPIELIPISKLGAAFFNLLIGIFLVILFLLLQGSLPYSFLLFPISIIPLLVLTAGLSCFLSALGVFFRDIDQLIGIFMSILLFLSPIFYPISAAPQLAKRLILLNPLTFPIEELRKVLIIGSMPNLFGTLIYLIISIFIFTFGIYFFQKSRPAFSDII